MATRTIAAFDFDGTLTKGDSLIPFLIFATSKTKVLWACLSSLPLLLTCDRKALKEHFLTNTIKGLPEKEAEKLGALFAKTRLDRYLRKGALEKIAYHLNQGHEVVLISANIDIYLDPWGKAKGFHKILSSKTGRAQGKIDGKLAGENCRGEEKVKQLLAWAGPKEGFILWAYGNSRGDKELLKLADYPHYREL